jgi:hypothetical protein
MSGETAQKCKSKRRFLPKYFGKSNVSKSHRQLPSFGRPDIDDDTLSVEINVGPDEI